MEILKKLYLFPERLRCMFLHLWCLGLRASEVCTLKGNAYYQQGEDYWIQVYQVKMKNYKRIPIPQALYQIMKVYLKISLKNSFLKTAEVVLVYMVHSELR